MISWWTLAVIAVIFSYTDGIFSTSIKTDIKTGIVQSIAGLVSGAVLINYAADRRTTIIRIIGVTSKESRRTLALCSMIIGYAYCTWATASSITNGNAFTHATLCSTFMGLRALSI